MAESGCTTGVRFSTRAGVLSLLDTTCDQTWLSRAVRPGFDSQQGLGFLSLLDTACDQTWLSRAVRPGFDSQQGLGFLSLLDIACDHTWLSRAVRPGFDSQQGLEVLSLLDNRLCSCIAESVKLLIMTCTTGVRYPTGAGALLLTTCKPLWGQLGFPLPLPSCKTVVA
jgi:hypothetical protein